jgi:hypothetical protein
VAAPAPVGQINQIDALVIDTTENLGGFFLKI